MFNFFFGGAPAAPSGSAPAPTFAKSADCYGEMWDKYHHDPQKLAKQAGFPAAWMKHSDHQPKNRADFISKMESGHYRLQDAAGNKKEALPICVALSLIPNIRSVLQVKYNKHVSEDAVFSAIMSACPEMLDEEGGIRPEEAIDKCNKANNQKGLLIPGPAKEMYWVQLRPHFFAHQEFFQALTMADRFEKLGCHAMSVVVKPDQTPPLHAVVTSNVGLCRGNAAMSAYDLQCEEGARQHVITNDDFHQLIVCNIDAREQVRGSERELSICGGFEERFRSDLNHSLKVTKWKSPGGCGGPMSCGRAQMDELEFNPELLKSIQVLKPRSFAEMRPRLKALREKPLAVLQEGAEGATATLRSVGDSLALRFSSS